MARRLLLLIACAASVLGHGYDMMQDDYGSSGSSSPSAQGGQPAYGQPAGAQGAQPAYAAPASGPSTPPAGGQQKAAGTTHEVTVGGSAGLVYTPSSVQAAVGDTVRFTFKEKNHTVTQSTFDKPCVRKPDALDSGFLANPDGKADPAPTWWFTVPDTKPLWFYCAQKGHCGGGMVFAVNPSADKTLDAFVAAAKAQNGTGAPMGAGGTPTTTAAAAPGASATTPPVMMTTSVVATPAATASAGSAGAAPLASPSVVAGQMNGSGVCQCFCGVGSFPVMGQGMGAMGGYPGGVPVGEGK